MVDLDCSREDSEIHSCFHFTQKTPIQPFLCSTLDDFHQERDYLSTEIFPQLDMLCRARGTYFKAVDLRWDTEEIQSSSHFEPKIPCKHHPHYQHFSSQQLKINLDYISSSFPFFICILGHQYGEFRPENSKLLPVSVASLEGLSKVEKNLYVASKNGYPWVLHEENQNCSLTELEIIQAAFLNDPQASFFYFRDCRHIEDKILDTLDEEKQKILSTFSSRMDYEELKVRELKTRIINKGLKVSFFRNLREFGELVLKDWTGVIEQCYPLDSIPTNIGHELSLERVYHEAFADRLCKWFVPSVEYWQIFETLDSFVLSTTSNMKTHHCGFLEGTFEVKNSRPQYETDIERKAIFLLYGDRGCGKSSMVSSWLKSFRQNHPSQLVISHYVGSSSSSTDVRSFLRRCITELRCDYFGIEDEPDIPLFSESSSEAWIFPLVVQSFVAAAGLRPCVLVLDGIDELSGTFGLSAQQVKEFQWLPQPLPPHCKIIFTTTSSDLSCRSIRCRQDVLLVHCPCQPDSEIRGSILQKHLAMPCKEVPSFQLGNIMGKKLSMLPVFLSVLGCELRTCGVLRDQEECLEEYLEVLSLQELWALVLQRWVQDYSWAIERKASSKRKRAVLPNTPQRGMEGWVSDTLCLICLSRCGLREQEVLKLLGSLGYSGDLEVSIFDWAVFRSATREWIEERPDGLLNFTHHSLRHAVEHQLLRAVTPVTESHLSSIEDPSSSRKTELHRLLALFFQQQHPFRRVYMEFPWHLQRCGDWSELHAFISDPVTVGFVSSNSTYSHQQKMDLVQYWKVLSEKGYNPSVSYQNLVREITTDSHHESEGRKSTVAVIGDPEDCENETNRTKSTFLSEALSRDKGKEELSLLDKCTQRRLIVFAAEILDYLRMTPEAEELLLVSESLLSETNMQEEKKMHILLRVQQCLGDLCYRTGQILCKLSQVLIEGGSNKIQEILEEINTLPEISSHPCGEATIKYIHGLYKFSCGDFSEAEICFQEALVLRKCWYGPMHPLVAEVEEYMADLLCNTKTETGMSRSSRRRALELYRHVLVVKEAAKRQALSQHVAKPLACSLASTLYKLGKLLLSNSSLQEKREAVELLQKAADLRVILLSPNHSLSKEVLWILKNETAAPDLTLPRQNNMLQEQAKFFQYGRSTALNSRQQTNMKLRQRPKSCFQLRSCTSTVSNRLEELPRTSSVQNHFTNQSPCSVSIGKGLGSDNVKIKTDISVSSQDIRHGSSRDIVSAKSDGAWPMLSRSGVVSAANHAQKCSVYRPRTVCQTSISGPYSTIKDLMPSLTLDVSGRHRVFHRMAWYHIPGRYPTLHKPFPPKRNLLRSSFQANR
ncbi:putative tetratricopeptide repeat protein 41 isoform X2 [Polyodon spathula]|uniref:putative tetratricopeptide repeat protein 41 isoform X2 n=1 Tax=Polyodon spathula TaxID=7913 RepID=UPI001B7ED89D|nr:putative tetratricopeptide repeat protein 41 isoform X2 [Polyodon spathula]